MMMLRLIFQTAFLALGQIWANKVRSILTTLGIIIAVSSILAVVACLGGLRTSVLSEFEKLGAKRVFIDGTLPDSWRNKKTWIDVQLKQHEVEAIREHCPSISKITPEWGGVYQVSHREKTLDAIRVLGIWPAWHDIVGRQIITGRPFNSIDEAQRSAVCIVNDKAVEELNLDKDPTGADIMIAGRKFRVVGVVETVQPFAIFGGGDVNTEVFIPFGTAQNLNPTGWINMAWGELASPDRAADAKAEVAFVLRRTRNIRPGQDDTFVVNVLQQFIDQFNSMAAAITAGAGGIVAISLLVGGIGIMNIMLVSVSERTREIGLRKAVGAKPSVVLTQFLVEAVVLCVAGGAVGIALGQALVMGVRQIPGAPLKDAAIPAWAIMLSVGFSGATGIVFGMFPAIKAARLDPIEALRHE